MRSSNRRRTKTICVTERILVNTRVAGRACYLRQYPDRPSSSQLQVLRRNQRRDRGSIDHEWLPLSLLPRTIVGDQSSQGPAHPATDDLGGCYRRPVICRIRASDRHAEGQFALHAWPAQVYAARMFATQRCRRHVGGDIRLRVQPGAVRLHRLGTRVQSHGSQTSLQATLKCSHVGYARTLSCTCDFELGSPCPAIVVRRW
jgi:hypothetical protein